MGAEDVESPVWSVASAAPCQAGCSELLGVLFKELVFFRGCWSALLQSLGCPLIDGAEYCTVRFSER